MKPPPRAPRALLRRLTGETESARRGSIRLLRGEGEAGVGYAVGKRIGNAVVRNRVRRRLRAAVAQATADRAQEIDATYLVIGLAGVERRAYARLVEDLRECFKELNEPVRS